MKKQKQKEPLSIMIAKTTLAIAVLTGLGTIIFGGGVVIMKYYNGEVNNNEIIQPITNEIVDFKVKGYSQTFSYESASMAMDCGFIDGKIVSGEFQGKELIVFLPNHTTEKYPKEDEIIKIFVTNKKSVLRNKFDEIYKKEFLYYCLEDKDMDGGKKNNYAFQEIFAFKMPDEKKQDIALLQSAEILGISLPIEIKEIVYYRDGGTVGVVAKDANNKDFIFCLDGRIREMEIGKEPEPYHIYLKATHPTHLNAQEIPIAGEKEKAILYILQDWADKQISKEEQIRLLNINIVKSLSEKELKIYRILKVINGLEVRNQTDSQFSTSDWQTYRNEEFGFEFEYLSEWKIEDDHNNCIDVKQKISPDFYSSTFGVCIFSNHKKLSALELAREKDLGAKVVNEGSFKIKQKEVLKVNDDVQIYRIIHSEKYFNEHGPDYSANFFFNPDNSIIFRFSFGQSPDPSAFQILSTFKFIEK